MVLIGLLLVALVCLALGLVLASAGWLIASLAVTALAAWVMWTKRKELAAPPAPEAVASPVAAEPDAHADESGAVDEQYQQRRAAWFAEGTAEGEVWVVDGRPDYHAAGCALLLGEKAEPIPHQQAVEDGFAPCAVCDPDATVVATSAEPGEPPATVDESGPAGADQAAEVWVVNGRPNYHRQGCAELAGADAEPVPFEQATEDGFTPCPVCLAPEPVVTTAPPPAARQTAEPAVPKGPPVRPVPTPQQAALRDRDRGAVWVVDGRPRYHRSDCMIIKGQDAEPIPYEQAIEDGFMPCSLCEPNAISR